jgi:two-component system nitrate/nitrite response regulator NarL
MSDPLKLIVVDDHPLYRSGVIRTLEESAGFVVVGEGASGPEAIDLCARLRPDVALLDISMAGGGIEAAQEIATVHDAVRVIMLTASEQDDDILAALAAGARGYVVKGVGEAELLSAIAAIARGETYVSPTLAARLLVAMNAPKPQQAATSPFDSLTAREEQILKQVSAGLSNKEVGRKLGLQEKTVKHYMTAILQKLQARNRVEAALKARERWKG